MHLLTTWLPADSTKALEIASPERWALPVVRDPVGVGPDVAAEFAQRLHQLALAWTGVVDIEVHLEVPAYLQGTDDVAVPEKTR